MKPGRELDAKIADVMGRCGHVLERAQTHHRCQNHHRCQKCGEEFWGISFREGYCGFPRYSTEIAAAWQVVEKLADKGYIISVCWGPGRDGRQYASIQMQLSIALAADLAFRNPRDMDAVGETVPLAICLAALKVFGVEVEDETK